MPKIISNNSWWPETPTHAKEIGCRVEDGERFLDDDAIWPIHDKGRKGLYLMTPQDKAERDTAACAVESEREATQRKHNRQAAYDAELGPIADQLDDLVKSIATAKTLADLQACPAVTGRMAIKARIPKP